MTRSIAGLALASVVAATLVLAPLFLPLQASAQTPTRSDGSTYHVAPGAAYPSPIAACRGGIPYIKSVTGWLAIEILSTVYSHDGYWNCEGRYKPASTGQWEYSNLMYQASTRASNCPAGWYFTADGCLSGERPAYAMAQAKGCRLPRQAKDGEIFGSPILPATAEKYRSEIDLVDGGPDALSFTRTYRSGIGVDPSLVPGPLGKGWTHSHSQSTKLSATPSVDPTAVVITSADGYPVSGAVL